MFKFFIIFLFLILLLLCTDLPFLALRHLIIHRPDFLENQQDFDTLNETGCCLNFNICKSYKLNTDRKSIGSGLTILKRLYVNYNDTNELERLALYFYILDNTKITSHHWPVLLDFQEYWKLYKFEDYPSLSGNVKCSFSQLFLKDENLISNVQVNYCVENKAFIFVHGGAMISGSPLHRNTKIFFSTVASLALNNSYNIAANLDYSLAPENSSPTALIDILEQICYLHSKFKLSKILLYGFSAGSFLVSQVFVLLNVLKLKYYKSNLESLNLFDLNPLKNFKHKQILEYLVDNDVFDCEIKFVMTCGFYNLKKLYFNDINISRSFNMFIKLYFNQQENVNVDKQNTKIENLNVIDQGLKSIRLPPLDQHSKLLLPKHLIDAYKDLIERKTLHAQNMQTFYNSHCPYTIMKNLGDVYNCRYSYFISDTRYGSLSYQAEKFNKLLMKIYSLQNQKCNDFCNKNIFKIYDTKDLTIKNIDKNVSIIPENNLNSLFELENQKVSSQLQKHKDVQSNHSNENIYKTFNKTSIKNHFFIYNCYMYASRDHLMTLLKFSN